MEYTLEYFRDKFQAIPDNKWITGRLGDENGNHCAYGHCGSTDIQMGVEAGHLVKLLGANDRIVNANDDVFGRTYPGYTPRIRVVNFLNKLIEEREKEATDNAVYEAQLIANTATVDAIFELV